jgi:hypothetical protein
MLPVGWVAAVVTVAILLTFWVTFTLTRLDRLHARVDAAQAALDAQLVRRAAALRHVLESGFAAVDAPQIARYERTADAALAATGAGREVAENQVGRVVATLAERPADVRPAQGSELHEACVRVAIARRFYNDAVRDTRTLRGRRMPRILRLAGHREMPRFFDIDDSVVFPEPAPPHLTQETSS